MPIDPSVLLYGLQPQARTPYDAQDVVAERRAHVEQLREAAKQKQQKEYEAKVYDWAIKSNLGPDGTPDIPAVTKALYGVSATLGDNFVTAVTKARKATADTYDLEDKHRTNQVTLLGQSAGDTDETNYGDRYQSWKAIGLQPEQFGLGPTWTPDTPTRLKAVGDAATTIPEQHKAKQDAIDHFVKGDFLQGAAQYVQARGANLTDGDVVDLTKRMTQFGAHPEEVRTVMDQTPQELQAWAPGVIEGPAKVAELAGQADTRAETKRQNDLQEAARQRADADRKAAAQAKAVMDADLLRHRRVIENKPTGGAGGAAATPSDPDVIKGYVNQIKNNTMFLSNVPRERRDDVVRALEQGGVDVQKLTAMDLTRKNVAKTIEPKITAVQEMARQIDSLGLTGTIGGRWRQLLSGEAAATSLAGLTPAQKQLVGKFVAEASGLLISGVAMAHGGARGGGSPQILEQVKQYLDPGTKDLNVYIGNLEGAKDFIHGYATMGDQADKSSAPAYHYDRATKSLVKGGK